MHKATEGNPFFVEEVVKHLAEEGRLLDAAGRLQRDIAITDLDVPAGVRLVVGKRLQRLSEASRKGLTAAAVVGRRFDDDLLAALGVGDADTVLDILDEAESAGLVASGATGYRFAHDLIRATILAELSMPRRQRMHLRVADAMERQHAGKLDEWAADLAHHLFSAGAAADPEKTVHYLVLAGRRALDAAAFEEALSHFEKALAIAPDAATATRAEMLQGHGRCCLSLGRWEEAVAELQRALDIYEAIGDADAVGGLAPNLAYLFTFASRYMEGMQVLRRGLAALGERRTPERGRLLSQLGMMTSAAGYREIGDPMLAEAQALAHDLDNPKLLAQVAQSMTFRHYSVSEWRETVKHGLEAGRLSQQTGDHYNTMNSTLLYRPARLPSWRDSTRRDDACARPRHGKAGRQFWRLGRPCNPRTSVWRRRGAKRRVHSSAWRTTSLPITVIARSFRASYSAPRGWPSPPTGSAAGTRRNDIGRRPRVSAPTERPG